MKQDMIVILDLGSTENTVLARQIRDMGVYSEIHPHDITVEELKELVMAQDPNAFVIVQEAHQVLGDGFSRYTKDSL